MEKTLIEWCDHSWSPWRGCTKVSAGCLHCYAETLSKRNPKVLGEWGRGRPRVLAKNWGDPVKWNEKSCWVCPDCGKAHPVGSVQFDRDCDCRIRVHRGATRFRKATVFPSLCDWLDEEVPIEWLADFIRLIRDTPNLNWLPLTKRPENWQSRLKEVCEIDGDSLAWSWLRGDTPSNVWPGTSCENQEWADKRIPHLLKIPAAGRFLSVEPMLGPVDFRFPKGANTEGVQFPDGFGDWTEARRDAWFNDQARATYIARCSIGIDWVIFGGESGRGARPCEVGWIRDGVRQCRAAGVSPFVKQLGADPAFNAPRRIEDWGQEHISQGAWISAMTHPKGGDPSEWPEDLRIREFPEGLK